MAIQIKKYARDAFAAIGALASLVVVVQFLQSSDTILTAHIYPATVVLPLSKINTSKEMKEASEGLKNYFDSLDPKKSNELQKILTKEEMNYLPKILKCQSLFRVEIVNDGEKPAKQVSFKIDTAQIYSQFRYDSDKASISILPSSDEGITIPEVRPGETIILYVWAKYPQFFLDKSSFLLAHDSGKGTIKRYGYNDYLRSTSEFFQNNSLLIFSSFVFLALWGVLVHLQTSQRKKDNAKKLNDSAKT